MASSASNSTPPPGSQASVPAHCDRSVIEVVGRKAELAGQSVASRGSLDFTILCKIRRQAIRGRDPTENQTLANISCSMRHIEPARNLLCNPIAVAYQRKRAHYSSMIPLAVERPVERQLRCATLGRFCEKRTTHVVCRQHARQIAVFIIEIERRLKHRAANHLPRKARLGHIEVDHHLGWAPLPRNVRAEMPR